MSRYLWRHVPHAVFFFSCACLMVVELVAGRLIAGHLGSSLYTWTAVIGVMLAGIAAGNLLGGRLADRYRAAALLRWLFLAAALACVLSLALNSFFAVARPLAGFDWPLRIVFTVFVTFILPAACLGTLSPSLAKIAVERARHTGSALGSFYGCGTAGSIAGTFVSGFWLIFAVGNTRTTVAVAGMLALLGLAWGLMSSAPASPKHAAAVRDAAGSDILTLARSDDLTKRRPDVWTFGQPDAVVALRYTPHTIAFLASACLMVVELLASRVIAEQAGSSLYTWASVIGVVFAGMSLGNYAGGLLADRFPPSRVFGWLFLAASASVVSVLVVAYALEVKGPFEAWRWPAMVFATVFSIFFLPSLVLGTFVPVAVKAAVQRATDVGTTIGSVSAWNAVGSIVGTLAAGFWLIPALGTQGLTMVVACVLAAAGLVLGPRRGIQIGWTGIALVMLLATRGPLPGIGQWRYQGVFRDSETYPFSAESAYQYVRVYDDFSDDQPDRRLRVLSLDHLIHGYVDLDDPTFLNYAYERVYAEVARRYAAGKRAVSAFFVGGGSYTFPRWLLAEWPGSLAVVGEIDRVVLEANHEATGLPRTTPIRTIIGDARNTVDDLGADVHFDFFFGDAFNDLAVPYHLTTLEFSREVAHHLKPDGAYLVNLIDNYDSGLLLGSFVGALRRVFSHVYVFCTERDGVSHRRDTFVVAASNVPLDTQGWERNHGTGFEGSVLTPADLASLERKCGGRILTDDNAPVEVLIAPVVRERTGKDR